MYQLLECKLINTRKNNTRYKIIKDNKHLSFDEMDNDYVISDNLEKLISNFLSYKTSKTRFDTKSFVKNTNSIVIFEFQQIKELKNVKQIIPEYFI